MFTLSPTLALTVMFIFMSKSRPKELLRLAARVGLSVDFMLAPIFSSAEPWVLMCTPPGPNIFSAGPSEKRMSVKSNLLLPFVRKSS